MPSIAALRRQRQIELPEFKSSLIYIADFRTKRATYKDPASIIIITTTKTTETQRLQDNHENEF